VVVRARAQETGPARWKAERPRPHGGFAGTIDADGHLDRLIVILDGEVRLPKPGDETARAIGDRGDHVDQIDAASEAKALLALSDTLARSLATIPATSTGTRWKKSRCRIMVLQRTESFIRARVTAAKTAAATVKGP
jgi:hypothetical protein